MPAHPRYGLHLGAIPTKIADPAGYEIRYEYDYKGRLEKVIAPREIKNKNDYTVKYAYNLIYYLVMTRCIAHTSRAPCLTHKSGHWSSFGTRMETSRR